jgi:hypothetical protein
MSINIIGYIYYSWPYFWPFCTATADGYISILDIGYWISVLSIFVILFLQSGMLASAGVDAWMLGCLDAWRCVRIGCLDAWMPGGVSGLEGFGDWKAEQL